MKSATWLEPILLVTLLGACATGSTSTTSEVSDPTSTTRPEQTTTSVPAPTTSALPAEPLVSAGWTLQSGDLLVSGVDGIQVVRQGTVVSRPVSSPVEAAFAGDSGLIFFVTPDPDRYPDAWPSADGGGGGELWGLRPDGALEFVLRADGSELQADGSEGPSGALSIFQVEDFGTLSKDFPDYRVTPILTTDPGDGPDLVWLAPTYHLAQWPRPYQPEEGDIAGAGWHDGPPGGLLYVAIHSGQEAWLERWTLYIGVSPWSTNPVPRGTPCLDSPDLSDCLGTVTALPETTLIAYTETDSQRTRTDLVIMDVNTGTEVTRLQVAEGDTVVKLLHASGSQIVVSLIRQEGSGFVHLPAIILDLGSGAIETLPTAGVATVVR